MEDLYALKREVTVRTNIARMGDEKVDDALDNVTDGAMKPHTAFTRADFEDDYGKSVPYLEHLLAYVTKQNS